MASEATKEQSDTTVCMHVEAARVNPKAKLREEERRGSVTVADLLDAEAGHRHDHGGIGAHLVGSDPAGEDDFLLG